MRLRGWVCVSPAGPTVQAPQKGLRDFKSFFVDLAEPMVAGVEPVACPSRLLLLPEGSDFQLGSR